MDDNFDPYYTWLGIRPEEQPPDHYRLIGLRQFEENADVIANAADRQMQFLRSMQVGKRSALSQKLLNEISTASGCLLDKQRKSDYDKELKAKAQAAKPTPAKAKPLPKATALEPATKPAQVTGLDPLPKSDVFSVQMPAVPVNSAYSAPNVTSSQTAASAKKGISPVVLAAAGGGALVLILLVAVVGYVIASGGKGKTTAGVNPNKAPKATLPSDIKPPNTLPGNAVPAVKPIETPEPPTTPVVIPPESPAIVPAATPMTPVTTDPPADPNWTPPASGSTRAFRSMLGNYMYWLDRRKMHPIINLTVPKNNNLWTPELQDKLRGQFSFDEMSYVGTARIAVPEDGIYKVDADRGGGRVLIDGVVSGGDFDQDKSEVKISKGIHSVTLEMHSHGQPWLQGGGRISLKHKETGQELEIFNTWQDIEQFLRTPIDGKDIAEISNWRPSPENELKIDPQMLAAAGVKTPNPGQTGETPLVSSPLAPSAPAKAAVPEGAALEKARKQLVEVFGEEARTANTPEKKVALASRMLQVATETDGDLPSQYALFDNARKLLATAGDADRALAAVDSLMEVFAGDPWPLKVETATSLSDATVPPPARDQIAARLLAGVDEAMSAQKFAAGDEFVRLATKVSAKGKDLELRKSITQKRTELSRLKQHFAAVDEARGKLAQNGNDAEANQVVGKFLALGVGDFESGNPYLAKGGQELYVAAANADGPATKAEKGAALAAADAWYKLAESLKGDDKSTATMAQRRARDWYQAATTEIQGLDKARVDKRLKELQGLATTNPRMVKPTWRTTPGGFPLVEGPWEETTYPLLIAQNEGSIMAVCQYQHPKEGQIRWQAEGTISKEGKISLNLNHIQAPAHWVKKQTRVGQLQLDGGAIQGEATSTAGKHQFVWKTSQQVVAIDPPRATKPPRRGKTVQGLVGRGFSDDADSGIFFTYHPGYKLTRDEIQGLQTMLGRNNSRVEFVGTLNLNADAEISVHHLGGSSNRGVHYLFIDDKEVHSVGDDRTKDDTFKVPLRRGDHLVRWILTGGDLGDAQLEIKLASPEKNTKLVVQASAEMVAAAKAPGAKREIEYGTTP